ncbi:MAG: DNA polymerase IV [Candidatus Dormibacteraeota bacterium]|uniref:DNA polymerase IV n=1 Tax=Candidatus Dormiibacter inghamiae TaxID=3127013 RepID=A0A934KEQ3_9BACT|nr:DNA polymerase IV [Candidatus Dormibacteraeota bacterium]MBJ7605389.1 DNA polymerase IV [Candidatus Dormibacteraeota bacterium]
MARAGEATILHADLDAFYASVEQLLDPSLSGRAVAVGGGVVLAASYEAKAFGIRAGMPGWRARRLCPDLRFVGGHFHDYQRLGDQVIDVLRDFTPLVERISIDEAFLDVAGTEHLFGSPGEIGAAIRRRVRREIGLAVSVGVARTKHLAKIASQTAKPDGLVLVEPDRELEFLHPLPVELMWGVGHVTLARLTSVGIRTIGDLAATSDPVLRRMLGRAVGNKLGSLATNADPRRIETTRQVASVGAQSALGRRRPTSGLLRSTLGYLADRVAGRLRAAGRSGRTITVRVRFTGLRSVTRSLTLSIPISASLTLTELSAELACAALADHPREHEITLLAVSVSQLVDDSILQLQLPLGLGVDRSRPGTASGSARWAVDRAVDAIRDRFGRDAVGYATVMFSEGGRVPEAFRQLAERSGGRLGGQG